MFAALKTDSVSGAAPDAQFNYVTMLLHGDGTNGAQNNTFLDSSTNNFTITRNGNTTQGSFSPYGSNWSNYFDNTAYFTFSTNSAYNFTTGSWTYECWLNLSGTSTSSYYTLFTNGYPIQVYVKGNAFETYVGTSNSGGGDIVNAQRTSADSVPVGSWVHFALVRNSSNNTYKMYVNGVEQASTTSATNPVASTANFAIGAFSPDPSGFVTPFLGYISNFRATASAVYTSNFTPSTTPLTAISGTGILTCQSNRFVDNSTNSFAFTTSGTPSVQRFNPFGASTAYSTSVIGGSGYFDGSGDYLVTSGTGSFNPRSTFTVEFWTYPISNNTVTWINSNTNNNFYFETSGTTLFVGDGIINTIGTSAPTVNQWTHMLLSFDGTTYRLFYNGGLQASSTSLLQSNVITAFRIGQKQEGTRPFNGYITDMRVLVGTALYTSAFTPPTAPLTAITNTALLTKFQNGAIFDNAMMNDLETVGNAQISTSVVKYGTGSLAFDGNGDYLKLPYTPNFNFTRNFTVECWVNLTSKLTNFPTIVNNYSTFTSNGGFAIFASHASGTLGKYQVAFNGVFPAIQSTTNISYGTWQHIALVRSGSTLTLYVDGVANGTSSSSANVVGTANSWWIGTAGDDITNGYLNGYIDDLRITKGYARYTANFTPPIAAFPNIGPY